MWRRLVIGLSAITDLVAIFLLLQWNLRDPRPELQGSVAPLALGCAILNSIFILTTDPHCRGGSGGFHSIAGPAASPFHFAGLACM